MTTIVSRAAAAILAARSGALDTRTKPDRSPVTAADDASEMVIMEGLAGVLPGVPIVSEEASGRVPPQLHGDRFVLVDPLDGTRELVAGRDEFCVCLAVVSGGRPRLGIIAAPALGSAHGRRRRRRAPAPGAGSAGRRSIRTYADTPPPLADGRRRRRGQPFPP